MKLMLNDPETNTPSTNRTIFWYGALICLIKLTLSKVSIAGYIIPEFSASDFAVALTALGGIYSLNKHIINQKKVE